MSPVLCVKMFVGVDSWIVEASYFVDLARQIFVCFFSSWSRDFEPVHLEIFMPNHLGLSSQLILKMYVVTADVHIKLLTINVLYKDSKMPDSTRQEKK